MPQANVLPVMNVMFLLIPALLLAMETASMAAISVSAPRTSPLPGPTTSEEEKTPLKVQINADAIVLELEGHRLDPIAASRGPEGRLIHDFEALENTARQLKTAAPGDSRVRISAELDVEYADLIAAMDALRGGDCQMGGKGESPSPDCYYWAPSIDSY